LKHVKHVKYRGWEYAYPEDALADQWPRVAQGPDEQWAYPHYTDERWLTARVIYGKKGKTTNGNYSDRLWQWDSKAAERAGEACKGLTPRTARFMETWLSAYHGRKVILRYAMGGVNHSSGYEYYFYGYDWAE
jgi:hypothetical protein